jgi:hypothetical protein
LRKSVLCILLLFSATLVACAGFSRNPPPTWQPPSTQVPTVEATATKKIALTVPPTLVVTSTPKPGNLVTAAAVAMEATDQVRKNGTPTPLGVWLVTATPLVVIVPTQQPLNSATAVYLDQLATAQVFLFGTPTPFPPGAVTATPPPTETPRPTATPSPSPTALPLLLPLNALTPTRWPVVPTPTPPALPALVKGKILFMTDRFGKPQLMAMDANGANQAILTVPWVYNRALELDRLSPDGRQEVYVKKVGAADELWIRQEVDGLTWSLHGGNTAISDPAFSPDGVHIAFVSEESKNDEIFVIVKGSKELVRLTGNSWEWGRWDKHPTFSPDGTQIVFWSNRDTGRKQIWIMGADGSNPTNLSNDEYNDWDPVWVK